MAERIFVSYSHHDAALVTPVVRLLRSTSGFVFQDTDSIKPGSKWRGALADAIRDANLVVIFWCRHANESTEVEREYLAAIEAAKDILPVLLDSTPMPPRLGEFQWVDFQHLVQHGRLESVTRAVAAPRVSRHRFWLAAATASAVLAVALLALWPLSGGRLAEVGNDQAADAPAVQPVEPAPPQVPPDVQVPEPTPTPPPVAEPPTPAPLPRAPSAYALWIGLFVIALALMSLVLRLRSRSSAASRRPRDPEEVIMAMSLAREIDQRLRPEPTSTTDQT